MLVVLVLISACLGGGLNSDEGRICAIPSGCDQDDDDDDRNPDQFTEVLPGTEACNDNDLLSVCASSVWQVYTP
jgi:hypothetical protein